MSGPSYVGGVCAGSASEGKSVEEILGGDPVPDCWDAPVSEAELAAMGQHNVPGPDGYTYYRYHCLTGIDPKTKTLEPGGMHISSLAHDQGGKAIGVIRDPDETSDSSPRAPVGADRDGVKVPEVKS